MMRAIAKHAGQAAAFLVAVALASPARSDTIYSLSDGASCRDKSGAVQTPRLAPQPAVAAEMTPLGMIQVTGGVNNRDCYFYMSEVGLEPPTAEPASCPDRRRGTEEHAHRRHPRHGRKLLQIEQAAPVGPAATTPLPPSRWDRRKPAFFSGAIIISGALC